MGKNKNGLISILLFIATGSCAFLAAFIYGKSEAEIIQITIVSLIGIGIVLFLSAEGREKDSLLFDNKEHFGRFAYFYLAGLAGAVIFPFLPVLGWPFMVIFIVLGLMSNQMVGMSAGSVLLLLTVLLENGGGYMEFFTYFISGMAGIVLFAYIDQSFRVGIPMLISIAVLVVCLSANHILMADGKISFETGFIVGANLLICILLLLVFLRFYSVTVVHKYQDKYMEINDPECPILVELKEKSKQEYYQAVHTAYLSDKIAKRLNLDAAATKACGYYHKIGVLRGGNSWEYIEAVCEEYRFPPDAVKLIKEYTDRNTSLRSKETVVVLFADTLVASILYLFSKNPKVEPNYDQIIDAIYEKKWESGILDKSNITAYELQEMKKLLLEEKLYYDFLR